MQTLKAIGLAILMLALMIGTHGMTEAASSWDGGNIRATGLGVAPAGTSGAQAEALARRAAISDAYRQIAEQIGGVSVDATTTVENLMLTNTTVRTHVSALIKGASVVEEKQQRDGSYTVTLEVPVYGASSLASTIFVPNKTPEPWTSPASVYTPYRPQSYDTTGSGTYDRGDRKIELPQTATPAPAVTTTPAASAGVVIVPAVPTAPAVTAPTAPAVTAPTAPAPAVPTTPAITVPAAPTVPAPTAPTTPPAAIAPTGTAVGGYTGVIIDCTGLGLRPVMSPVVKAENGRPIYGYKNLDADKIVSSGMASYAHSASDATRAGTNPLRLRAVAVDGGANPVLSAADANRLLLENSVSGFLDATNVVFIR